MDTQEYFDYINVCVENGIVAIDTETTGLDPISDKIVGMSLYTPDKDPVYIPLHHISYEQVWRLKVKLVILMLVRG